jgi:hypothetical protein
VSSGLAEDSRNPTPSIQGQITVSAKAGTAHSDVVDLGWVPDAAALGELARRPDHDAVDVLKSEQRQVALNELQRAADIGAAKIDGTECGLDGVDLSEDCVDEQRRRGPS